MKDTQFKVILKAMFKNKDKRSWKATDFQNGEHFVGYEASARMSDLMRMYPGLFIVGREDRFRTLRINWEYDKIKEIEEML